MGKRGDRGSGACAACCPKPGLSMTERHAPAIHDRIHEEMLGSFDEELELEIDDDPLDTRTNEFSDHTARETIDRRLYFKELIRLQGELVKLQDWVQHHKLKVVVIFEGRDSAGKGGVIKRITQRLNPRICRVAALPAPSERERTQWYFHRYVSHLMPCRSIDESGNRAEVDLENEDEQRASRA